MAKLAESWWWTNDGRRLNVNLRPGILFHDRTPLDATLAATILREAINKPGNRATFPSLIDVVSVRAQGARTIVFDVSQPSAFLPDDLEIPMTHGSPTIGTGPFRVVNNDSSGVTLERFADYYLGPPKIQRVIVRPFDALRTAWASLLRGDVDMVTDVPPEAVEFIHNDDVQVIPFERRYQYLVAFNSAKRPFSSPLVRRALNFAVNRETLITNVLRGNGTVATGPIWPKYWAYDNGIRPYAFDPQLSESLLDAAGFHAPSEGKSQPNGPPARFRFTCLVPAGFSTWQRIGLEVQKSLYNVGVDMQFEVIPIKDFDARVREGRFEAALISMISGPTPGRPYIFWRSARHYKGLNVFGYENPEAERLFDVLRTSSNEAAVRSATRSLQRTFLDDPPAIFLAWNERARAVRRTFQVPSEPGRDPVQTVWRWSPAINVLAASAP